MAGRQVKEVKYPFYCSNWNLLSEPRVAAAADSFQPVAAVVLVEVGTVLDLIHPTRMATNWQEKDSAPTNRALFEE